MIDLAIHPPRLLLVGLLTASVFLVQTPPLSASPTLQHEWGGFGTGPGQFDTPTGVALDTFDRVYVADYRNDRIQKFSLDGTFLTEWGATGTGPGQFDFPAALAVGPDGLVYVADQFNHRIQSFTSSGTFVAEWGTSGLGPEFLYYPYAIAISSDSVVFVLDTQYEVKLFSLQGTFISVISIVGECDSGFCPVALGLALSLDEQSVFVTTSSFDLAGGGLIHHYSRAGSLLNAWGDFGSDPEDFGEAGAITVGRSGFVFVTDGIDDNISVFQTDGTFIGEWGTPGNNLGDFGEPSALAEATDLSLVVAQGSRNVIQT